MVSAVDSGGDIDRRRGGMIIDRRRLPQSRHGGQSCSESLPGCTRLISAVTRTTRENSGNWFGPFWGLTVMQ